MIDEVKQGIDNSLEIFQSAIDRTSNLEIVCAEVVDGKDILVVENSNVDKSLDGHQCEIDVSEIFAVVSDCKKAQQFIDVINGDRSSVILNGITRIVGYYSRTHNWNKSKIGELRDRQKGNYSSSAGFAKAHDTDTLNAVEALSK
jgi:hypothetical protein